MHLTLIQPIESRASGLLTTHYEAKKTLTRDVVPMPGCCVRFIRGQGSRVSDVVFDEDLVCALIYFETWICGPIDPDLLRAAGWKVEQSK